MTETLTKDRILAALKGVKGPDLEDDIVSLGLVSEVVIHKGKVYFAISVDPARASELEELRLAAENVVKEIPGVEGVAVTLTADREPGTASQMAGPSPCHSRKRRRAASRGRAPPAMRGIVPAACQA
jgi:ATP-binding protein involved in chromosome partitioning